MCSRFAGFTDTGVRRQLERPQRKYQLVLLKLLNDGWTRPSGLVERIDRPFEPCPLNSMKHYIILMQSRVCSGLNIISPSGRLMEMTRHLFTASETTRLYLDVPLKVSSSSPVSFEVLLLK